MLGSLTAGRDLLNAMVFCTRVDSRKGLRLSECERIRRRPCRGFGYCRSSTNSHAQVGDYSFTDDLGQPLVRSCTEETHG